MCHRGGWGFRMLQELIPVLDCHNGLEALLRVQDIRSIADAEEFMIQLIASFTQSLQDVQITNPLATIIH